jgi:hypothetical protein
MVPILISALCLVYWVTPVSATQADTFDPDQPFEEALGTSLLRSLLNQALDRLEDHVEISGNLSASDAKSDRTRHLRFKFYPEGKSKSQEHLSAEGWLRSTPEFGKLDWHFRFKLPEEQSKQLLPQPSFEAPL